MAAIANITVIANRYVNRSKDRSSYLEALEPGNSTAQKMLERLVLNMPDFEATGTTDTNTATSPILNLTDLGVPFATAETGRVIIVESYTADDNGYGFQKNIALVRGHGTTPVVEGQAQPVDLAEGAEEMTVAVQSNKVVVNCVGITGDNVRWYVKVWVGDAFPLAFLA